MALKVVFFQPFWSEIGYRLWPFWSQIGYGFLHSCLESVVVEEVIRPTTQALHNAFNINLNKGTNYETDLKQGAIDLRSGLERGIKVLVRS